MKRAKSTGLLRLFIAFFAGVMVTLFLLIPGKHGPTVLVNGDRDGQVAELGSTSDKIEKVSDTAMLYAYRARQFLAGGGGDASP